MLFISAYLVTSQEKNVKMAPVTKNQVGGIFTLIFVGKDLHYEVISQGKNSMQFNKCDLFFILLQLPYFLAHMP